MNNFILLQFPKFNMYENMNIFRLILIPTQEMFNLRLFLLIQMIFTVSAGTSQVIRLENASFEGEPRDASVPMAWHGCEEGTTPDILPGPWGVYLEANDGDTYVGLITRDNGTWESIGQRLSSVLQQNTCYTFSMDLAHSNSYSGYNGAIRLRIWGGASKCEKTQLLVETEAINEPEWKNFIFQFKSQESIQYLILEAYFPDSESEFRGNLLIDDISPIRPCSRT
jgi:hypothetical protein